MILEKMSGIRRVNIKAIVNGFVCGVLAVITASLLVFWIDKFSGSQGVFQDLIAAQCNGTPMLILGLLVGCMAAMGGGYIAGRMSKTNEVLHGGIVGCLYLLMDLVMGQFFQLSISPAWHNIISMTANIPMGMLGGYFAANSRPKSNPNQAL